MVKAAVCREFGKPLAVEDIELAAPNAGEVQVDIKACAICHSDIFYAEGAWGGVLPAVYGHEAAGVVEQVGPGVRNVSPGDHVVVTLVRSCGECPCCARGYHGSCEASFPLDAASPLSDAAGNRIVHGLRTAAFAIGTSLSMATTCEMKYANCIIPGSPTRGEIFCCGDCWGI